MKLIYSCRNQKGHYLHGVKFDQKRAWRIFWGNENVLYLDRVMLKWSHTIVKLIKTDI